MEESKNPFLEIKEGGYILSEETITFLDALAKAFVSENYFYLAKDISQNYKHTRRLHVILLYIDYALSDCLISNDEYTFIQNLKKTFGIKPGAFYKEKFNDIQRILALQFYFYYWDHIIDFKESQEIGYLQAIFDLDSNQINDFELSEIHRSSDVENNGSTKTEECYVYLMRDNNNQYFKIGISNRPEWREKTLQSEEPAIELIAFKKFVSRKMASSLEKALHDTYADKRIRGEWFQLDIKDIEEIKITLTT